MSIPLIDCRTKVREETDRVLRALAHARGVDKAEVAREWLDQAAAKYIHEVNVFTRIVRSEGTSRASEGEP